MRTCPIAVVVYEDEGARWVNEARLVGVVAGGDLVCALRDGFVATFHPSPRAGSTVSKVCVFDDEEKARKLMDRLHGEGFTVHPYEGPGTLHADEPDTEG